MISERQVGMTALLICTTHKLPGRPDRDVMLIFPEKNEVCLVAVDSTNGLTILTIRVASSFQTYTKSPRIVSNRNTGKRIAAEIGTYSGLVRWRLSPSSRTETWGKLKIIYVS